MYQTGKLLVANFYDLGGKGGLRNIGARVQEDTLRWVEDAEVKEKAKDEKGKVKMVEKTVPAHWEGRLELQVFPPLEPAGFVALKYNELHKLMGPRETEYTLTEPTLRDMEAINRAIAQAQQNVQQRVERPKRTPHMAAARAPKAPSGLATIVAAKAVKLPLALCANYKGKKLVAKLLPDGRVEYDGNQYDSPSTAAGMARKSVVGAPKGRDFPSTNGWTFWSFIEKGKPYQLDELRSRTK